MTNYILWMDFESRMNGYDNGIIHVGTMREMRHYTKETLSAQELATLIKEGTFESGEFMYTIEPMEHNTKYISLASAPGAGGEINYFDSLDSFKYPDFIDANEEYSEYIGACCIYDVKLQKEVKHIDGKIKYSKDISEDDDVGGMSSE